MKNLALFRIRIPVGTFFTDPDPDFFAMRFRIQVKKYICPKAEKNSLTIFGIDWH